LFELTIHELRLLARAPNVGAMGSYISAIASEQGVAASQVLDAIWAATVVTANTAGKAMTRDVVQSLAGQAVLQLKTFGTKTVLRHAARASGTAALEAGAAAASGGEAVALSGAASSAYTAAWGLSSVLGIGLLVAVVVGAGVYFLLGRPTQTTSTALSLENGVLARFEEDERARHEWSLVSPPRVVQNPDGDSQSNPSYRKHWTYTSSGTGTTHDMRVFTLPENRLIDHYATKAWWSALPARISGPFRMEIHARADLYEGQQIEGRIISITAEGARVRTIQTSVDRMRGRAVAGRYVPESSATLEVTPDPGHAGDLVIHIRTNGYAADATYRRR